MKVSVVIPVYNGERFLAAAVESVLAQDYPSVELLLVDDGSTDASRQIAEAYAGYGVICLTQKNSGVAAARNAGLDACSGELIAFLDQDDLWLPNKVSRQVSLLLERPEIGYVLTWQRYRIEADAVFARWLTAETVEEESLGVMPSTLMARRETFAQVGKFDESYQVGSDLDWFFRATEHKVQRGELVEVLVERRIHSTNASQAAELMESERMKIIKRSIARRRQQSAPNS